jgi:ATP-dependent DNA helicase RecG
MIDSQSYFDLLKLPYPETREAVLERLVSERILCRTKNGLAVTNLGAVLFAKRLEDFNEISRKAPRVIVYDGTSKLRTKREQTRTYLKIVLAAS